MKPKIAFAFDASCWTGLTLFLIYLEAYWAAGLAGTFALIYLGWSFRTLLHIIKIEQEMEAFLLNEFDERDYH